LKFQAIYPAEPPILGMNSLNKKQCFFNSHNVINTGYIRGEAIYPRECVFTLHSRETWVKEAKVVKLHEKPYKIVKTMKYDRSKNKLIRDIPLELFGIWQTKDYEPPIAENGLVPRNGYGNVELFKTSMLPIGNIILQSIIFIRLQHFYDFSFC
jgi:xeroderma pigmentosum group C-complementing protein